jgi:hypothetical protein
LAIDPAKAAGSFEGRFGVEHARSAYQVVVGRVREAGMKALVKRIAQQSRSFPFPGLRCQQGQFIVDVGLIWMPSRACWSTYRIARASTCQADDWIG